MQAVHVLHRVSLAAQHWGGVQVQFAHFLAATRNDARLKNYLTLYGRPDPSRFGAMEPHLAAPPFDYRTWRGVRLPAALRPWAVRRRARDWRVEVVLNINLMDNNRSLDLARQLKAAPVYWERGSAWFPRAVPAAGNRSGYSLVIVNSLASGRMLREVWGLKTEFEKLTPCVWNEGLSQMAEGRGFPRDRPLRLGFAARLRAFKGGVLAVHTLAELRRRGADAVLAIAGDGPDEPNMREAAAKLGVTDRVEWLGHVRDMPRFFASVDVLLHPALREPYGNICAEAAMAGIPVVTTLVDGLPEVVEHGVTGLCVPPELGVDEFARMGGNSAGVYRTVFRPELDRVGAPGAPSPAKLADAVLELAGDAETYLAVSRRAASRAAERFAPAVHIDRFVELMRLASTRR